MDLKIRVFVLLILSGGFLLPHPALAGEDSHWSIGISAGQSQLDLHPRTDVVYPNPNVIETLWETDESARNYSVFAAYRFNRHLGAELAYSRADGASIAQTIVCSGPCFLVPGNPSRIESNSAIELKRLDLTAVGVLPLGDRWELYAKAGASRIETESNSFSSRKTVPVVGAGASFLITQQWALRLQWDRALDAWDDISIREKMDVDTVAAGVEYRF